MENAISSNYEPNSIAVKSLLITYWCSICFIYFDFERCCQ